MTARIELNQYADEPSLSWLRWPDLVPLDRDLVRVTATAHHVHMLSVSVSQGSAFILGVKRWMLARWFASPQISAT